MWPLQLRTSILVVFVALLTASSWITGAATTVVATTTALSNNQSTTAKLSVVGDGDDVDGGGGCNTFQSCKALNLQYVQEIIREHRCSYIENITEPGKRKIHFLHIPKAGGTSIDTYLQTHSTLMSRYDRDRAQHEHYGSAEFNTKNKTLMTVILRNPALQAISLFHYIRVNKGVRYNGHWNYTNRPDVTLPKWAQEPLILNYLDDGYSMFNRTLENGEINVKKKEQDARVRINRARKGLPLSIEKEPVFEGTPIQTNDFPIPESAFIDRIERMVPMQEYRCEKHMRTAHLLIRRFSVVATLEKQMEVFWKVLSARANLHMTNAQISAASGTHLNKSSKKAASAAQEAEAHRLLTEGLRCQMLLWEIAEMIGKQDMFCPVVKHSMQRGK